MCLIKSALKTDCQLYHPHFMYLIVWNFHTTKTGCWSVAVMWGRKVQSLGQTEPHSLVVYCSSRILLWLPDQHHVALYCWELLGSCLTRTLVSVFYHQIHMHCLGHLYAACLLMSGSSQRASLGTGDRLMKSLLLFPPSLPVFPSSPLIRMWFNIYSQTTITITMMCMFLQLLFGHLALIHQPRVSTSQCHISYSGTK